jgi:hypothetical protein
MDFSPMILSDVISSKYLLSFFWNSLKSQCNNSLTGMNLGKIIGLLILTYFGFFFTEFFVMDLFKKPEQIVFEEGMIDNSLSFLFVEFSLDK